MNSQTTGDFWELYHRLPESVRRTAQRCYALWQANPHHPSLHFKSVHETIPLYSVRIGRRYRTLGLYEKDTDTIYWFWIGTHAEYDKLIEQY